jgi:beta-phosphoglucomutase family hydrolase
VFDWSRFGAVLLDLDGVVTATAKVHAAAWKFTFDNFLASADAEQEPFDIDSDYRLYVDGRPRYDGVAAFLDSRDIILPLGDPEDAPGHDTVCSLGNLKNQAFNDTLKTTRADAYPDALALLDHLEALGMPMAIVSASANCTAILESVGLASRLGVRVDGLVAKRLGLRGKPEPDTFEEAARRLGVPAEDCVVVEDAVSGVAAGKAGGFGFVIGVDRHLDPSPLIEAGADLVVSDLRDLLDGQ